jgi:hypothetical protein
MNDSEPQSAAETAEKQDYSENLGNAKMLKTNEAAINEIVTSKLDDLIDELSLYHSLKNDKDSLIQLEILNSIQSKFDSKIDRFINFKSSEDELSFKEMRNKGQIQISNKVVAFDGKTGKINGSIVFQLSIDKEVFDSCFVQFIAKEKKRNLGGVKVKYWDVKLK